MRDDEALPGSTGWEVVEEEKEEAEQEEEEEGKRGDARSQGMIRGRKGRRRGNGGHTVRASSGTPR